MSLKKEIQIRSEARVMELELEDEVEITKCSNCLSTCKQVTTFLLSHVGLISLVVGYCIMGAFTFEYLERDHEIEVKKNMSFVRQAVAKYLWSMTQKADILRPDEWHHNATKRLQEFETELIKAMKKGGWDGTENVDTMQWTFSGALFYSIVVITTIGYGHITPKTMWGKVVTIFYAILGIPLMLLCLSHIGDFMASVFRILYWKCCCYFCTRKPKPSRRMGNLQRGRSHRSSSSKHSGSSRGMRRSIRRSGRVSQRSADSALTDSVLSANSDPVFRRVHSEENLFLGRTGHGSLKSPNATLPRNPQGTIKQSAQLTTNRSTQRSSRSADPFFTGPPNFQTLPILCNKYAEDAHMVVTDESEVRRSLRLSRIRPQEHYVAYDDYWDEEDDYYEEDPGSRPVPIWLCVFLVLSYILFGAFLFNGWEHWNFLDSAYFCFITLTTIGFGDFVPAQRVQNDPEISIALCSLYLLFGISLLAMSFNLVQEEVINSVKQVAARLGIIKEEDT